MNIRPILFIVIMCAVSFSCNKGDDSTIPDNYSIIYPNGTEALIKGIPHTIRWNAPSGSQINIELCKNSEYFATIEEDVKNSGEYKWDIADDIPAGFDYSIRIVDRDNPGYAGESNNKFRILEPVITSAFTDKRDGQSYKTVKIGEQWWMAENFNYKPEEGSYCYSEEDGNCKEYGRHYTFDGALKHFPSGWHLPTDEEWYELESYLGIPPGELDLYGSRGQFAGTLLKAEGDACFNALFGGYYNSYHNGFGHQGWEAHFWTSSKTGEGKPIIRVIDNNLGGISRTATINHGGCSVRYVKD